MNGETWWMLSSGEYSDYRVHAVFERQSAAEAAAKEFSKDYEIYRAEEVKVYPDGYEPEWVTTYRVHETFLPDGLTTGAVWQTYVEPEFNMWFPESLTKRPKVTEREIYNPPGSLWLIVCGSDETAVRKVYTERKASIAVRLDQTGQVTNERERS